MKAHVILPGEPRDGLTAKGVNHSLSTGKAVAEAMTKKGYLAQTMSMRNKEGYSRIGQGREPRLADREQDGNEGGIGTGLATKTKPKVKKPDLYRVLLLNDDFTPMEFVIHILERFFRKSPEEAQKIMLHVHNNGVGECGVYTYEVAETKVTQVMDFARKNQHPLQCVMEKK